MKKVLNVGGNSKKILLPQELNSYQHVLLDIDPKAEPDVLCDARQLSTLEASSFDAIYCSHNLEHYYRHDVPKVLSGFKHVLKEDGFVWIRVPDMHEVMKLMLEKDLDIEDVLYESEAGPIMVLDVIYGYSVEIERSGVDFFAHKTGFTVKSLKRALDREGFAPVYMAQGSLNVSALAFKAPPSKEIIELFQLPN